MDRTVLIEKIKTDIATLFGDTTVSKQTTIDDLDDIKDYISDYTETLELEILQEENDLYDEEDGAEDDE